MKKLNLDLAELSVESFETLAPEEPRGTVHAHASWHYQGCTPYEPCNPVSGPDYTVDYSCDDPTCYNTCDYSCGGGSCYESCNCPTVPATCAETCQQTVPC
jgi:hypothetical protein